MSTVLPELTPSPETNILRDVVQKEEMCVCRETNHGRRCSLGQVSGSHTDPVGPPSGSPVWCWVWVQTPSERVSGVRLPVRQQKDVLGVGKGKGRKEPSGRTRSPVDGRSCQNPSYLTGTKYFPPVKLST